MQCEGCKRCGASGGSHGRRRRIRRGGRPRRQRAGQRRCRCGLRGAKLAVVGGGAVAVRGCVSRAARVVGRFCAVSDRRRRRRRAAAAVDRVCRLARPRQRRWPFPARRRAGGGARGARRDGGAACADGTSTRRLAARQRRARRRHAAATATSHFDLGARGRHRIAAPPPASHPARRSLSLIADAGARSRRSLVSAAAPPRPHVIADAVAVGGAGDGRPPRALVSRGRRPHGAVVAAARALDAASRRPRHPLPNGLFRGVRGRARAHTDVGGGGARRARTPTRRRRPQRRSCAERRAGTRPPSTLLEQLEAVAGGEPHGGPGARAAVAVAVDHAAAEPSDRRRDEYIVRGRDSGDEMFFVSSCSRVKPRIGRLYATRYERFLRRRWRVCAARRRRRQGGHRRASVRAAARCGRSADVDRWAFRAPTLSARARLLRAGVRRVQHTSALLA